MPHNYRGGFRRIRMPGKGKGERTSERGREKEKER